MVFFSILYSTSENLQQLWPQFLEFHIDVFWYSFILIPYAGHPLRNFHLKVTVLLFGNFSWIISMLISSILSCWNIIWPDLKFLFIFFFFFPFVCSTLWNFYFLIYFLFCQYFISATLFLMTMSQFMVRHFLFHRCNIFGYTYQWYVYI